MDVGVKSLMLCRNPKFKCQGLSQIKTPKPSFDGFISCKRLSFSHLSEYKAPKHPISWHNLLPGERKRQLPAVSVVLSDFSVPTATIIDEGRALKISVEVSGVKTRAVFDKIFEGMVAAAQPIPGFRRVKGVLSTLSIFVTTIHPYFTPSTGQNPPPGQS